MGSHRSADSAWQSHYGVLRPMCADFKMRILLAMYLIFLCFALDRGLSDHDFKSRVRSFLCLSVRLTLVFLPYAIGYTILEIGLLHSWWDIVIGMCLCFFTVILLFLLGRKISPQKLLQ